MEESSDEFSNGSSSKKSSSSGSLTNRIRARLKKKATWRPSVGDQVEARWAGGKDPQFTGWYIAEVTKLHRNGNRVHKVSLRYVDGSLDTDVKLSDIRKRSVGAVRVPLKAKAVSSKGANSNKKKPKIGKQYQVEVPPFVPPSSTTSTVAAASMSSNENDEEIWNYEVATCDADYEGDWNGEWETCRVVSTFEEKCRIVCQADGKEIDNVPQRFVRRIDVFKALNEKNTWSHEVATCNADYEGIWDGEYEPCRIVGAKGDMCHIVCEADGKEVHVKQRFVRRTQVSKNTAKLDVSLVVKGSNEVPLLASTVKSLITDSIHFAHNKNGMTHAWSQEESDAFDKGMIMHGKAFRKIRSEVGSQSTQACTQHYYRSFKGTKAYKQYKEHQDELSEGALPPGWKVVVRHRGALGGARGVYKIYVSPDNKKFRSLAAVNRYFVGHNIPILPKGKAIKGSALRAALAKKFQWIPSVGEVVEAKWNSGSESEYVGYYTAHVVAHLPPEENGGQQLVSLCYFDGSIDTSVPLGDIRKRLDEDVVGRRVRRRYTDGTNLFGKVVMADVQEDMFLLRFDNDEEFEVTSAELRTLLTSKHAKNSQGGTTKRRMSTIEASIEKLPKGWQTVECVRKSGKTAGTRDRYFISPEGKRYRSFKEVERLVNGDIVEEYSVPSLKRLRSSSTGSVEYFSDSSMDSVSSPRGGGRKKKRRKRGSTVNPCANLPPGWKAIVRQRGALGGSTGTYTYYVSPAGKKFRSLAAVLRFLREKKKTKTVKKESGSSSNHPSYRKDLIGRTILKSFKQTGDFKGVIQYASEDLSKDGATVYHVLYDDGDTEELQFEELEPFLVPLKENGSVVVGGSTATATANKKRKLDTDSSSSSVTTTESELMASDEKRRKLNDDNDSSSGILLAAAVATDQP